MSERWLGKQEEGRSPTSQETSNSTADGFSSSVDEQPLETRSRVLSDKMKCLQYYPPGVVYHLVRLDRENAKLYQETAASQSSTWWSTFFAAASNDSQDNEKDRSTTVSQGPKVALVKGGHWKYCTPTKESGNSSQADGEPEVEDYDRLKSRIQSAHMPDLPPDVTSISDILLSPWMVRDHFASATEASMDVLLQTDFERNNE